MDLATIIGLLGGSAVIIAAIVVDSSIFMFINIPSVLIVLGGTIAAMMIRFPMRECMISVKVAFNAFVFRLETPDELIQKAVELAALVRKEGLLALENQEVTNRFLKKGLRLCADGLEPEFVRKVLKTDLAQTQERHDLGRGFFLGMGESAPAFGMIGTLIGLVQMLSLMDDPKQIGPSMAVALLTTLYGALIANLFALPVAQKLDVRARQETLNQSLIIESIASIQESRNPRVVEELLRTYLPNKVQIALEAAPPAAAGGAGAQAGAET